MNLTQWARSQGVSPRTAFRWFESDTLPVAAVRINSRSILVQQPLGDSPSGVALYARVSSHDQKDDLVGQLTRLEEYADQQGLNVVARVGEVGSGMSGRRAKITLLLRDPEVGTIVVEHRDRLGRMNIELIEAALAGAGRSITVVEESELDDDLVRDMTEVMTSFCARLYGRRGAANRARRAIAQTQVAS